MTLRWCSAWTMPAAAGLALVCVPPPPHAAAQRITVDGRLSPAQTLRGPDYAIGAELGRQVGGNLFHSFGAFGLNRGETARFSGPPSVGNVIGRVTGGAPSAIDGTIRSTIPGANVWLINPSGVVFGRNARVDVSGSFHAGSADYLRHSDGARFQATNPEASTLTAAPPAAFGFLSPSPRPVTVNGATLGPVNGTLGLVGGPVTIRGGLLEAPAGMVHVIGAAGPGEVPADPRRGPPPTVAEFAPVRVTGGARIDAGGVVPPGGGGGDGSVFIRAGTLGVEASTITAGNFGPGPAGVVSLRADRRITIAGIGGDRAFVQAAALSTGRGADIRISTGPGGSVGIDAATVRSESLAAGDAGTLSITTGGLALRNGAVVLSNAAGGGNGGAIGIGADSVLLDGTGTALLTSTSGTRSVDSGGNPVPAGAGGRISVAGGTLVVRNGAKVITGTGAGSDGAGGTIRIDMSGSVLVAGTDGDPSSPSLSAISTLASGTGRGGSVALRAGALTFTGGALVSSDTSGTGAGGAVALQVSGDVAIANDASGDFGVRTRSSGPGRGGDVTLLARTLTVDNGTIRTSALGRGDGGAVTINADRVLMDRVGWLISETRGTGFTDAAGNPVVAGTGGSITLNGRSLTVQNRSLVASSSQGSGAGGAMALNLSGDALVTSASEIRSVAQGQGAGGAIRLDAGTLVIGGDATASSVTRDRGSGGTIAINAGRLVLRDGGWVLSTSEGRGDGGNIALRTGALTLRNGGQIRSTAESRGDGGLIGIEAGSVLLDGETSQLASVNAGTGLVDERGTPAAAGAGGRVELRGGALALRNGATIVSTAEGDGPGGAVTIDMIGDASVTEGASISAGTRGRGDGGNLSLSARGNLTIRNLDPRNIATGIVTLGSTPEGPGPVPVEQHGDAGSLMVTARDIAIHGVSAFIGTNAPSATEGRAVTVAAAGDLVLDASGPGQSVFIEARSPRAGTAYALSVSARNIALLGRARIEATNPQDSARTGGDVTVTATGELTLSGDGSRIDASTFGRGDGGAVTVSAQDITIRNGLISADTSGAGKAGTVRVTAAGALTISGTPGSPARMGMRAQANRNSTGAAGDVIVRAGSLVITQLGEISSSTFGKGDAGNVTVEADSISLQDSSILSATDGPGHGGNVVVTASGPISLTNTPGQGLGTGIGAQTGGTTGGTSNVGDAGDAGDVTVRAGSLVISDAALINANTFTSGKAGTVTVIVSDALVIDGRGAPTFSGIISQTEPGSTGNGGRVAVSAGSLTLLNGGGISSDSIGLGAGGVVEVTLAGPLLIDARGTPGRETGIFARAPEGSAPGGDVRVSAGSDIRLLGPGPQIATSSPRGTGDAGSIAVSAPRLVLRDGASISTEAREANGGNITITARDLLHLVRSSITTSVDGGRGSGGNIVIDPRFVVLNASRIEADAGNLGDGGNIVIRDSLLVQSADSVISADSAFGRPGTITLSGPPLNLGGSLVVLASELRAAAALLRESCAVRGAGPRSSLVAAGRGGLRQDPETTLPALYIADRPVRADQGGPTPETPAPAQHTSLVLSTRCG